METRKVNDNLEITRRDDQIFIYKALKNSTIDVNTVKQMTILGDEWNGTALCANLIDIRDVKFIESKARAYGAEQYRSHVAGQAILIESVISSYFANLFLKFSNPKVPTKLFTKENEAVSWLKVQMRKHNS